MEWLGDFLPQILVWGGLIDENQIKVGGYLKA